MPRLLHFSLAGFLLAALSASGCYSERLPPPTFRHACGGDADCGDGESCLSGLCQVPCTMATATEDCGLSMQGGAYLACINGACSSACNLSDDPCPGAQTCTEIPVLSEQLGAGLCMEMCSPSDPDSCPDGEACFDGFCATTCDPTDPLACPEGETCLGVCVPGEVGMTAGEAETAGNDGGSTQGDTE
jgi:hypothetical protein